MNPLQFNSPLKITWHTNLTKTWQECFYPSVVEKLEKSQEKFENSFEIKDLVLDHGLLYDVFGPVYDKEVSSRPDYHLDRKEQFENIMNRISSGTPYNIYCIYEKSTNNFTGGILYRVKDDSIAISLRAFDKDVTRNYRFRTTADYWVEAHFFNYVKQYGKNFMSHGRDKHPRIGGIGLWLYKLKVGSKPHTPPEDTEIKTFTQAEFEQMDEPVLLFDNPDENGYYKDAYFFYKKDAVDLSFMNEVEVVLGWAQINTHVFSI